MASEKDAKVAAEFAQNTKLAGEYAEEALDAFQQQLKVVSQMRDAMEEVAKIMYALCQQDCNALNPDVWKKVTKEVLENGKAANNATKSIKKLAEAYEKKLMKAITLTVAVMNGLIQGLKNVASLAKSAVSFAFSIADAFYEVGKSIISIPFKMIEGLFSMATRGGSNELMAALEAIRKDFGDLSRDAGKAIVSTAKSMNSMKEYGLNATRLFGGLAERMKAVHEMANELGGSFDHFKDEVEKSGVEMILFKKGLGLTAEAMQGIASQAIKTGKPITEIQKEMTIQSQAMSKQFGVTAKIIAKDMGKAMADLAHFGHLSSKEMAVAAVFAQKLGVSVDKLTAIMDATKTYDQTVESMSKLNETFGTNIDFMKIMQAQTPQEQIQILREEFAKTGKDMSQLNRFERDLIKQATNMDDAMLNAAFSTKNVSVSLGAMTKAAEKNSKAIVSTKDAIKSLKNEMDAITPSGGKEYKGPFDAFFDGILRGIQITPEFIGLMQNIRQVTRVAIQEGINLGRKFVNAFPGVKEVFEGLKEIFDPARWRKLFHGISKVFDDFASSGSKDVNGMMEKLQETFLNFFEEGRPAYNKFMDGLQKFGVALLGILVKAVDFAWKGFRDFFKKIIHEIEDPSPTSQAIIETIKGVMRNISAFILADLTPFLEETIKTLTGWLTPEDVKNNMPPKSKLGAALDSIFHPIVVALNDAFEKLTPLLKTLLVKLVVKLKDLLLEAFSELPWEAQLAVGFVTFGPAVSTLLGAGISTAVQSYVTKAAMEAASKEIGSSLSTALGKEVQTGVVSSIESASVTSSTSSAFSAAGATLGATLAVGVGTAIVSTLAAYKFDQQLVDEYNRTLKEIEKQDKVFFDKLEIMKDRSTEEKLKMAKEELVKAEKFKRDNDPVTQSTSQYWSNWWSSGGNPEIIAAQADRVHRNVAAQVKKLEADLERENEEKRRKAEADAAKALEEKRVGSPAYFAKLEDERNKQIEEEKRKALADLGPVTIENAAERFKKIEELSKKVMSKDFNIGDKIKEVREKINDINWTLVDAPTQNKINESVLALNKVAEAMTAIADIGGLTATAGQKLSESAGKFKKGSPELQAIEKDGVVETVIKTASDSLKSLDTQAIVDAKAKVHQATDLFESVLKFSDQTKDITDKIANTSIAAVKSSFATTLKTVEDMVATVQKMDNALAKLDNINIGTRLTAVASSMGLGATGVYTVQSKDVVMNIQFNVTMDAQELETIMISNKNSVIRDRINFLIDNTEARTSPDAATAQVKSVAPQSGLVAGQIR